jgi:Fur family ferric uptake transcriptional regulator
MAKAGLLRRYDLGDHVWRFELVADPCRSDAPLTSHAHFLCTECGDVQCLDGVELAVTGAGQFPRSVVARSVEVQVRGVCDTCA